MLRNNGCDRTVQRPAGWRDMRIIGRRVVDDNRWPLLTAYSPETVNEVQTAFALIQRGRPTFPFLKQVPVLLLPPHAPLQLQHTVQRKSSPHYQFRALMVCAMPPAPIFCPVPAQLSHVKSLQYVTHHCQCTILQTTQ